MNITFFFVHIINDSMYDMLETALNTLRLYSDCNIIVATDNIPEQKRKELNNKYKIKFLLYADFKNQRMFMKYVILHEILKQNLNDIILCSDIDIYFKCDPFKNLPKNDILVTTRFYEYKFPINGGILFVRSNNKTIKIFGLKFKQWSKRNKNKDWFIDQNYLIKLYKNNVTFDIGSNYNYCPPVDLYKLKMATQLLYKAYKNPEIKILHLKGALKNCIYDGIFKHSICNYNKQDCDWRRSIKCDE